LLAPSLIKKTDLAAAATLRCAADKAAKPSPDLCTAPRFRQSSTLAQGLPEAIDAFSDKSATY